MLGTSLRTSLHTKVITEARSSCLPANWGVAYLLRSRPVSGNGRSVRRKGESSAVVLPNQRSNAQRAGGWNEVFIIAPPLLRDSSVVPRGAVEHHARSGSTPGRRLPEPFAHRPVRYVARSVKSRYRS
jgi:hypothetical protein